MEVTFSSAKLAKTCNSESKLRGEFGVRMARTIMRRLKDLAAAESLETMRMLGGRCHELRENLKGKLALDLEHPDRLVFEVANEPRPEHEGGNLDWSKVTKVRICGIGDYHN
jgi:proteic killer suppression protein